jgi:2',3'-cyclic-nucleotide 2'-phosphodiesterase (5'-nucleotidase family)
MELRIKAGVARFINAMKVYRAKYKLVAFSGDLFFPSRMSTMFDGEQMVIPFNLMNPDVSCLGNHELDQGYETAKGLIDKTICPWLMTNLIDKSTGKPIMDLKPYHIIE